MREPRNEHRDTPKASSWVHRKELTKEDQLSPGYVVS